MGDTTAEAADCMPQDRSADRDDACVSNQLLKETAPHQDVRMEAKHGQRRAVSARQAQRMGAAGSAGPLPTLSTIFFISSSGVWNSRTSTSMTSRV